MKPASKAADYDAIYADLARLPENFVGEIIDGELHAHPRPSPRHAQVSIAVSANLYQRHQSGSGGSDGWRILVEPELKIVEQILVPDVAGWRTSTLPQLPDSNQITIRPDWVCEVLSPSTEATDRNRKLPIYAGSGVGHAWLIDPINRTVEVFVLKDDYTKPVMVVRDSEELKAPPFESTTIDLNEMFDW